MLTIFSTYMYMVKEPFIIRVVGTAQLNTNAFIKRKHSPNLHWNEISTIRVKGFVDILQKKIDDFVISFANNAQVRNFISLMVIRRCKNKSGILQMCNRLYLLAFLKLMICYLFSVHFSQARLVKYIYTVSPNSILYTWVSFWYSLV